MARKHCGLQGSLGPPLPRRGQSPYSRDGLSIRDALPGGANQGAKLLLQNEMWNPPYGAERLKCRIPTENVDIIHGLENRLQINLSVFEVLLRFCIFIFVFFYFCQ